jgi:hypothetical protein
MNLWIATWGFFKDGQVEAFLRPLVSDRKTQLEFFAQEEAVFSK